jgi:DNA-binding transcriptional MerR regulator
MKNMSIEELAEIANRQLNEEKLSFDNSDGRYGSEISIRRIRDYMSKGILDKPLKTGRNTYFTETHLNQLLNVRKLQAQGLSDSVMQKASFKNVLNSNTSVSNTQEKLQENTISEAIVLNAQSEHHFFENQGTFADVAGTYADTSDRFSPKDTLYVNHLSASSPSMSSRLLRSSVSDVPLKASFNANASVLGMSQNIRETFSSSDNKNSGMKSNKEEALDLLKSMTELGDALLGNPKAIDASSITPSLLKTSPKPKLWVEYPLNNDGTAFLKVDTQSLSNMTENQKKEILDNVNNQLDYLNHKGIKP